MNKAELIEGIVEKSGLAKKDVEKALKAFEETVTEELQTGGKVQLIGFGTFEVIERKARVGKNPKTNETMDIPACLAPKFKVGKKLKDAVNI